MGVDALTYGLSTLVMAHDVLGEAIQQSSSSCQCCEKHTPPRLKLQSLNLPMRTRRGNYYARFTRKFSLGNGPSDWVSEYSITKEGGKMLGTLVALAIGRMHNLEAFVWDMPTGVLRDVWIALASLANRDDSDCRLEKVWVRWHDNRDVAPFPRDARHHTVPSLLHGNISSLFHIPAYPTVEFPTFSILPALKSITVLDIDELSYAEELGILLERSLEKVQELRVGVAAYAQREIVFRPRDDRAPASYVHEHHVSFPGTARLPSQAKSPQDVIEHTNTEVELLGEMLSAHSLQEDTDEIRLGSHDYRYTTPILNTSEQPSSPLPPVTRQPVREASKRKLKLSTLELERVYLSIPVLSRAIDWSRLESLTLLGCTNHEELWSAMHREFAPASLHRTTPSRFGSSITRQRANSSSVNALDASEYKLKIKRLHTDTVSKSLLGFIKNTLAPDTLEWLFLQRTPACPCNVSIEDIYRSAIRRHKSSLHKLLIDSEYKHMPRFERERPDREPPETHWQDWLFHEDLVTCITSGKMRLRELSMSIDHKKWHYFLQRLPYATSLRSLHISHIANHPNGRHYDREEIARSLLNIIAVRPEIELCYFGIEKKCYEILEYTSKYVRPVSPLRNYVSSSSYGQHMHSTIDEDDENGDNDDGGVTHNLNHIGPGDFSDDDDDDDNDHEDIQSNLSSRIGDSSDDEDTADNDDEVAREFKLREILFYDDKISIFKARHGKL
ncbi:hypothetical protein LTR05_006439 [Lithohypha guttulata]|uniref:F-box domain-containing protein n=1 Tax=Lithohypha guttulata TaxID=1690604 RepID=A0AAN7SXD3_9EURO|nr:hypothetical protein LTR05_006439 [Lithohypha guttulata]